MQHEGIRQAERIGAEYERLKKSAADEIEIVIDWSDLVPSVRHSLQSIYTDGGAAAYVDTEAGGTFDQLNVLAEAYARERAAELVGMKWIDGELVTNPNAEWAITDTTRANLRELIDRAFAEGMQPSDLKTAIREAGDFSAARADLIAETELSDAQNDSALEGWKASGVVAGKQSILGSEHDDDDICNDNADAGVIGLDEEFPSGDQAPTYHPKCVCDLVAEVMEAA